MSIAKTAPKKFDFQDYVCIEMMLRFYHDESAEFRVEPTGREDGQLFYNWNDHERVAEIQVKGAEGRVELKDVASCLAHFPERKSTGSLFERLLNNPNSLVVLVMTARCDDSTSVYIANSDWAGQDHPKGKIRLRDARALASALSADKKSKKAASALSKARQSNIQNIIGSTELETIREALHRLVVLEQFTVENVKERCRVIFSESHGIPSSQLSTIFNNLHDVVKEAKECSQDAFPLVRRVIASVAPLMIKPSNYQERGDESAFLSDLSHEHVLLLSGPPRVGKTNTARWIASEYERQGFHVHEVSDAYEAERLLLNPNEDLRLVVLDDPLGGTHALPDSLRILSRIELLASKVTAKRKLIVSQVQSLLLEAANKPDLSSIQTSNQNWRDLGIATNEFRRTVWGQLSETEHVPKWLVEKVSNALGEGLLELEPGCLRHLAVFHEKLQESAGLSEITRFAREDAADLGRALQQSGHGPILMGISIGSVAGQPIELDDLAFLAGKGGARLPGLPSSQTTIFGLGSPESGSGIPIDISYEIPPKFSDEELNLLDTLERRQVISFTDDNVSFTHPFYRSVAEGLLSQPTYVIAGKIESMIKRGLHCRKPSTSRSTARNLQWIFDRSARQEKGRRRLINLAIGGLESYFPSTRDLCFQFLLDTLIDMPIDRPDVLDRWTSAVISGDLDSMNWVDGEPVLPVGFSFSVLSFEEQLTEEEQTNIASDVEALNGPASASLSAQRTANVLSLCSQEPERISTRSMGRLLSYDEALIRARAVELWLCIQRDGDDEILERIFSEIHPRIARSALMTVVRSWHRLSEKRRSILLGGLRKFASSPTSAIVMLNFLAVFDRPERAGNTPPWVVFETLTPIILNALPTTGLFSDARFYSAMKASRKWLSVNSLANICEAWIGWLERTTDSGFLPSDYALGVGDFALSHTMVPSTLRCGLIERLTKFSGTGGLLVFVADIVDHWERLDERERELVEGLVAGERIDSVWIKAAVLSRQSVPNRLWKAILGAELPRDSLPRELLEMMDHHLLDATIMVYSGRPQPFWWLGIHHVGEKVWEPIIELIAANPKHRHFDLAWDHILFSGNGARVASLIRKMDVQNADHILNALIRVKVGCVGSFMPEAWAELFNLTTDAELKANWIEIIAKYAPAILDDLVDLREWMGDERGNLVAHSIQSDLKIAVELIKIGDLPAGMEKDETTLQFVTVLKAILREFPPRLRSTYVEIRRALREMIVCDDDELMKIIGKQESEVKQNIENLKGEFVTKQKALDSWVGPK